MSNLFVNRLPRIAMADDGKSTKLRFTWKGVVTGYWAQEKCL
jgi:hypothetical protein